MCTWQIIGNFDEDSLIALDFAEVICLTCWTEYYAEFADCPEPLAGIG
jgi:hypothetical protein